MVTTELATVQLFDDRTLYERPGPKVGAATTITSLRIDLLGLVRGMSYVDNRDSRQASKVLCYDKACFDWQSGRPSEPLRPMCVTVDSTSGFALLSGTRRNGRGYHLIQDCHAGPVPVTLDHSTRSRTPDPRIRAFY